MAKQYDPDKYSVILTPQNGESLTIEEFSSETFINFEPISGEDKITIRQDLAGNTTFNIDSRDALFVTLTLMQNSVSLPGLHALFSTYTLFEFKMLGKYGITDGDYLTLDSAMIVAYPLPPGQREVGDIEIKIGGGGLDQNFEREGA